MHNDYWKSSRTRFIVFFFAYNSVYIRKVCKLEVREHLSETERSFKRTVVNNDRDDENADYGNNDETMTILII